MESSQTRNGVHLRKGKISGGGGVGQLSGLLFPFQSAGAGLLLPLAPLFRFVAKWLLNEPQSEMVNSVWKKIRKIRKKRRNGLL